MKGRESNRNKDKVDIPTINSIEIFGERYIGYVLLMIFAYY